MAEPVEEDLRILLLEDSPADAELAIRQLRDDGLRFEVLRVDRREAFTRALQEFAPGIVLADYNLAGFDGGAALEIARTRRPDVPVIMLTGAVGDEAAVELLRAGAWDYVLKDRIGRLAAAVRRALADARDMRERTQAGLALHASELRFRTSIETLLDGFFIYTAIRDANGRIRDFRCEYVNAAGCALAGLDRERLLGRPLSKALPWFAGSALFPAHVGVVETGEPFLGEAVTFDGLPGDGPNRSLVVDVRSTKLHDGFASSWRDVSGRVRAMEEQARSAHEIHDLYDKAPCGYHSLDPRGVIVRMNDTELEWLGYTHDEVLGRMSMTQLLTPESRPAFEEGFEQLKEGGAIRDLELDYVRKDGTSMPGLLNAVAVRDAEGRYVSSRSTVVDMTERRRMEGALNQSRKLEAIGRLAGGIAHDFNNLLTAILGYGEMLLEGLEPGHPLRNEANEILKASRKASVITRQLLVFSHKQVIQRRLVDLNEIIESSEQILRRLIGEDVQLVIERGENLGAVLVDPGQIEQVIVNLAINARDAMPFGGRLLLSTRVAAPGRPSPAGSGSGPDGPFVELLVSDTGCGMAPEVRLHLFEPFFTTKPVGQGTGLGMWAVYGIVTQAGGQVFVESEPGRGTMVRMLLPRVDAAPEEAESVAQEASPAGTETVLLVEDDASVRDFAARALRGAGYGVLSAANGVEALRVLAGVPCDHVAALVTDVVMPQMGGLELARLVQERCPDIPVLFVSGYAERCAAFENPARGIALLHKPFMRHSLLMALRDLLDQRAAVAHQEVRAVSGA